MLNHACVMSQQENVCFSILDAGDKPIDSTLVVKLISTRDILAGEPLRISYHELLEDPAIKLRRIQAHCGGSCRCSLCLEDSTWDSRQLCRAFTEAATCQQCGKTANRRPCRGDLVSLQRMQREECEGLCGRVAEVLEGGACVVLTTYCGQELRLQAERGQLVYLGPGCGAELLRCGRCQRVYFCSRACQQVGWKAHREFCSDVASSWEEEYGTLRATRRLLLDNPVVRQQASLEELTAAFESTERFVHKWTQPGRCHRLAAGHYAVQDAVQFALVAAVLMLWQQLSAAVAIVARGAHWVRAAKLSLLQLRHVRALVPRFHIAHWGALRHTQGLRSLWDLQAAGERTPAEKQVAARLSAELERHADVVLLYDPDGAAKHLGSSQDAMNGTGPSLAEGARLLQEMVADPAKLEAFYSIDPAMPLEAKMARMAALLGPERHTSPTSARRPGLEQSSRTRQPVASPALWAVTRPPTRPADAERPVPPCQDQTGMLQLPEPRGLVGSLDELD